MLSCGVSLKQSIHVLLGESGAYSTLGPAASAQAPVSRPSFVWPEQARSFPEQVGCALSLDGHSVFLL